MIFIKNELWVTTGDLWKPEVSQDDNGPHGKLLRLDINTGKFENLAKGFRSPLAIDQRRSDGLVIIGHNGADTNDSLFVYEKNAN